jgi:hypothetical protein
MAGERGRGIEGLKLWLIDNLVSRGVGFVVRLFMMVLFVLVFVFYIVFAVLALIFWICMPAIVVVSFVYIFI